MTLTQTMWKPKVADVCYFELEQQMETEQSKEGLLKLNTCRYGMCSFGAIYS